MEDVLHAAAPQVVNFHEVARVSCLWICRTTSSVEDRLYNVGDMEEDAAIGKHTSLPGRVGSSLPCRLSPPQLFKMCHHCPPRRGYKSYQRLHRWRSLQIS